MDFLDNWQALFNPSSIKDFTADLNRQYQPLNVAQEPADISRLNESRMIQLIDEYKLQSLDNIDSKKPDMTDPSPRERLIAVHSQLVKDTFRVVAGDDADMTRLFNDLDKRIRTPFPNKTISLPGPGPAPSSRLSMLQPMNIFATKADIADSPLKFDISCADAKVEIAAGLQDITSEGLEPFDVLKKQLEWVYSTYVSVCEEICQSRTQLKEAAGQLDDTAKQIDTILSLSDSDSLSGVIDKFEEYMGSLIEKLDITSKWDKYKGLLAKQALLRETVHSMRDIERGGGGSAPECSVCVSKSVSIACVPCGHTFCEGCAASIRTCLMCRARVEHQQKLFFN